MGKMLDLQNVLDDVRVIQLSVPNIVKRIGIFGSLTRGTYGMNSDIDVLVEYDMQLVSEMEKFTQLCALCNNLQETLMTLYRRDVDVVQFSGDIRKVLDDADVEKDVIWV